MTCKVYLPMQLPCTAVLLIGSYVCSLITRRTSSPLSLFTPTLYIYRCTWNPNSSAFLRHRPEHLHCTVQANKYQMVPGCYWLVQGCCTNWIHRWLDPKLGSEPCV